MTLIMNAYAYQREIYQEINKGEGVFNPNFIKHLF